MTDYLAHVAEDRRLVILKILEEAPGYKANDSVVRTALERFGHVASRDQVRGDLAWLAEQGLVAVERVAAQVQVASLTERGHDVAAGRAAVPGVKKPGPR